MRNDDLENKLSKSAPRIRAEHHKTQLKHDLVNSFASRTEKEVRKSMKFRKRPGRYRKQRKKSLNRGLKKLWTRVMRPSSSRCA